MGRRGFTLLELVVATTIMAIAVVGLLSALAGSVRNAARLGDYDRVVQLAQLRMNDLLLDEGLPRNAEITGRFETGAGVAESGWRARLTAFEMPPVPLPGQMALDRIQLEVWWMQGAQRRTFNLDGYRRYLLKPEDIPPAVTRP